MIRIGVVGMGGMGWGHTRAYNAMKGVKVVACCDINEKACRAAAEALGVPSAYTDHREMLKKEKLDAVSCSASDAAHCPVSLATIKKGLHIFCEKPLTTTLDEAKRMAAAAEKAGVISMVNFSYRSSSALQHASKFVQDGGIGELRHVEASYLQSWLTRTVWGDWVRNPAWMWRLSTRHGSAGVLGDLGCHIYDMTAMICGGISEIDCRLKTFKKGVRGERIGEYILDANDSYVATVVFKNDALGTVHSTRWASGQANSLRVRAYGTKGAVDVDLDRSYSEYLQCVGQEAMKKTEWTTVKCKPTPENHKRFIAAIRSGKQDPSDFQNGLSVQKYLHYSAESDRLRRPVKVR